MARQPPRFKGRELTHHVRELGAEASEMLANGDVITRDEALARLLWEKALGYTKLMKNKLTGQMEEVYFGPEAWAIQLIYERREGKVAQAEPEKASKPTTAEKVSELSKSRINSFVGVGAPAKKGPPPIRKGV